MKHKDTISAIVGGAFFAVPYLALSIPIIPSLAIGTCAFAAGEMVFKNNKKITLKESNLNLYKELENAKKENKHILETATKVEDKKVIDEIKDISEKITKIIETIEQNPEKYEKIYNFFDYYLPTTVKIIDRYDMIEDKRLSSKESADFFDSTYNMLITVDDAYKKILDTLYQKEILDTDIDIKVFKSMLKADGFDEKELKVEKKENE